MYPKVFKPITIGMIEESQVVLGKPFPLVLVPKNAAQGEKVNFVQLQEYLQKHHTNVIKAASLYGAVMFKGFEIVTGEEWASVLY